MTHTYKRFFSKSTSLFLFMWMLYSVNAESQTFSSSNLPIILIDTDLNPITKQPLTIPDAPKVLGRMRIIFHPDGSRNNLTDVNTAAFLTYDGRIGIEVRGTSSQYQDKKPYSVTTLLPDNVSNNNVNLLGMPSENDWILNSLAYDPTLIRDYLSYNISRNMGNYATRTAYCEVVVNGSYRGLYVLQEKIKADGNRVNISKIGKTDIAGTNLTGGYITKADKTTGGDPVAWTMSSYSWDVSYIHELPKPADVKVQQDAYISGEFNKLATSSHANNVSLLNGFPTVIDIPSFIDFMLSNELASNPDAYQFSTYFHKDKEAKLRAGPIWDLNLTYGNDLFDMGYDRSKTNVWQFSDGGNDGSKFWADLFNNSTFGCYFSKRWYELIDEGQPMNYDVLSAFIDNTVAIISEAKVRENQKWGRLGNYPDSIAALKTFLSDRIDWISYNIDSYESCADVVTPSLVITKIDYNPIVSVAFPNSSDQEFIEIRNMGTSVVNLSGIYFKELGVSYQFPYNSTVAAGASIFLASNPTIFLKKYGIPAFGKFTRNLSNTSEHLVLVDAFGNEIDRLDYSNTGAWPAEADGKGSYLQLIDLYADNNVASNWKASSNLSLPLIEVAENATIQVFPNPATDVVTFEAAQKVDKIEFFDVSGNLVKLVVVDDFIIQVDLRDLSNGFYLVKLSNSFGVKTAKILKQ